MASVSSLLTDQWLKLVERVMAELSADGGVVSDASRHHLAAGGSRVRARLALNTAVQLALPERSAVGIAAGCELLHNASLVHDDLQDGDEMRRGRAAVSAAFGADVAVLTGDHLISSAYAAFAGMGSAAADVITIAHQRVTQTIAGQSADLSHRGDHTLTTERYEHIAAGKSAPLLSLPLEAALIAAGHGQALDPARKAARHFALGYQIADDLADVGQDRGAGDSVNLVLVLMHAGRTEMAARHEATVMAERHLDLAQRHSADLPSGAGGLLVLLADRIAAQLSAFEAEAVNA